MYQFSILPHKIAATCTEWNNGSLLPLSHTSATIQKEKAQHTYNYYACKFKVYSSDIHTMHSVLFPLSEFKYNIYSVGKRSTEKGSCPKL